VIFISEVDIMKMTEVEKAVVWVVTDNYYDALRPDGKFAKRYRVTLGKSIHAEHGLSYYLEIVVNGKTAACMFDFGLDPIGVMNNIKLLGLDLEKIDAFVLSHGHLDHWTGAMEILKQKRMRIVKDTPFFVGEDAFLRRFTIRPGSDEVVDIGQLNRKNLEQSGAKVRVVTDPTPIIPGLYCTGNIERVTAYEKMSMSLLVQRGETIEQDDFRGEQALLFSVRGKGLVVLSGCAHAGIVNTVKQAGKIAGAKKVHAILGGFHLTNAEPEIVQQTIADIRAFGPDLIVPTHCTGFEAVAAFAREMPTAFNLNTAGTQYIF
jgi:7,8-dihydropterin-6-yl-methyl-4-(beta-D-ribofuranosyl)aminobenzene 5'-phosphate synthase